MSIVNEFRNDEERVLDRLVDGELSQAQRRELLAALDDEPGAWRRCALAFLEAQSWRWQLSRRAAEPLVAQVHASAASIDSKKGRSAGWRSWLAIAAGLLVAFGMGTQFQSRGERLQANNPSSPSHGANKEQVAQGEWLETGESEGSITRYGNALDEIEDEETIALTLADGDNGEREISLPVTSATEDDQDWTRRKSVLPVKLVRSLRQAGLEVSRQQRFMPIELEDGRRLVVPIEEIEIHDPQLAQYQ